MKLKIVVALVAVLALTACSSRYSPNNWFGGGGGRSTPTLAPDGGYPEDYDPRPLVDQVVEMKVEPIPGGAIVTAVGLPPTQGYWGAELVPAFKTVTGDPAARDGVMQLQFKIIPPAGPRGVVNQTSREVTDGFFLSDQSLAGVRTITVVGARNQRSSSRQ